MPVLQGNTFLLVVGVSTEDSVATLGDLVLVFDDPELVSVLQGNTFLFVVGVSTEDSVATLWRFGIGI